MGSYTTTQADNTSTVAQQRIVRYQPVVADGFTSLVRWMPVDGRALKLPEIGAGGTPGSVTWVDDSTRAATSEALPTKREVGFSRVQGSFEIGRGFIDQYSNEINQKALQESIKQVLIGQQLGFALVDGNRAGATQEPNGLFALSGATELNRRVSGGPAVLSTAQLDSLLDAIGTNGGLPDFLVMSGKALSAYRALYGSGEGVPVTRSERTGRLHCSYSGVAILRDDHIPNDMGAGSDTYIVAVSLDALAFIYPQSVGNFGMEQMEFLEPSDDELHVRVTQNVGIAVLETYGFAVLDGVTV